MNKIIWLTLLIGVCANFNVHAKKKNPELKIKLEIPKIVETKTHEPYVAIWLETKDRQAIATLAVWYRAKNGGKWLKDLRQWWRKAGKDWKELDAVTSATKKPGVYSISWNGQNYQGETIKNGEYILHIEAVREKGGREHLRTPITLPLKSKAKLLLLDGKTELGKIEITS